MAQQSMRRDRESQLGPMSNEGRGVDWVRSTNTIRALTAVAVATEAGQMAELDYASPIYPKISLAL